MSRAIGEVPARVPGAANAGARAESLLRNTILALVVIAAFEGAIRYGLHELHLDYVIYFRDVALFAAMLLVVVNADPLSTHGKSVAVFALLVLVHGAVSVVNLATPIGVLYGLKLFLPMLAALLVPDSLLNPSRRGLQIVAVVWTISVAAATIDKFWVDYPWVGLSLEVAGLQIEVVRDWQSTIVERVGGLTRSSINLAIILPLLCFILLAAVRSRALRLLIGVATLTVVYWTTQKGAILGCGVALAAWACSSAKTTVPLKFGIVVATVIVVAAPVLLIHFSMPRDQGTFSFESLIERVEWMWPGAWHWINRFPAMMGVGLGGISGAQRFYAPADHNAADNLFIYLYANFGLASIGYLALLAVSSLLARIRHYQRDSMALASILYLLLYGLVISLLEDQIAALWLGAAWGRLLRSRLVTPRVPMRTPSHLNGNSYAREI